MFDRIKDDILGKKYSLSIAFISPKKSQEINKKYRKKDKPTNILAFPFSKNEGEILLCRDVIKKEARNFDKTYDEFLVFLVIHGMLHLKGWEHSSRMDKAQDSYFAKHYAKHFHRNRRGVSNDKSRGGRNNKRRKKS